MSEISKGEWAQTQELLLKLAQILSPIADSSPSLPPVHIKFFIPPRGNSFIPMSRPIRLLSTLQEAQKEVSEWVETLERKNDPAKSLAPKLTPSVTVKPPSFREEPNRSFKEVMQTPAEAKLPREIVKPAQQAIGEVRRAIQLLSHSTQLQNPSLDRIQTALKTIQPAIDRLVEIVEQHKEAEPVKATPRSTSRPVPANPRAHLFHRTIEREASFALKPASYLPFSPRPLEESPPRAALTFEREPVQRPIAKNEASEKLIEPPAPTSPNRETKPLLQTPIPTTLPGAPFTPPQEKQTSSLKRKRKRLFSQDDDDEEKETLRRPHK